MGNCHNRTKFYRSNTHLQTQPPPPSPASLQFELECCICLGNCATDDNLSICCGQPFHNDCWKRWYDHCVIDNKTCPMCRAPLNQATHKKKLFANIRRIFNELEQNNQIHTEYILQAVDQHEEESDESASVIDNTDITNIENIFRINERNIRQELQNIRVPDV